MSVKFNVSQLQPNSTFYGIGKTFIISGTDSGGKFTINGSINEKTIFVMKKTYFLDSYPEMEYLGKIDLLNKKIKGDYSLCTTNIAGRDKFYFFYQ
jgi:hypothetical protein